MNILKCFNIFYLTTSYPLRDTLFHFTSYISFPFPTLSRFIPSIPSTVKFLSIHLPF